MVDFDNTILDCKSFEEIPKSNPMKDAKEMIEKLMIDYEVVILTARGSDQFEGVRKWLKNNGFPELEVTNRKRPAIAYIDDRGLRFTNWRDVARYFL